MLTTRYFSLSAADVAAGLGIGLDQATWLSTAYSASEPVGVIVGCWLASHLSLHRVLLSAVWLFLVANAMAIFLQNFPAALVARTMIGAAAGAIMPMAILVQLRSFGPAWRIPAIAVYACSTTMAPQLAGSLDAWAVLRFGWTSVQWLAFAPGMIALVAGHAGSPSDAPRSIDLDARDSASLSLLSVGLAVFACAVSQGDHMRWFQSPLIAAFFAFSLADVGLFAILATSRTVHPVILFRLIARPNVALGTLFTLPLQFAAILSGAIIPEFLVNVQGFRPQQIAPALTATLLPQVLSYTLCAGALHFRMLETRVALILGLALVAFGCFCDLTVTSDWTADNFLPGQIIQGVGLPFIILPLLSIFIADVNPHEGIQAACIFNVMRSLSTTIAAAWAATTMRLSAQNKYDELVTNTAFYSKGHQTMLATIENYFGKTESDPLHLHAQALQLIAAATRKQAATLSTADTIATLGWTLLASCFAVVLMPRLGRGNPEQNSS